VPLRRLRSLICLPFAFFAVVLRARKKPASWAAGKTPPGGLPAAVVIVARQAVKWSRRRAQGWAFHSPARPASAWATVEVIAGRPSLVARSRSLPGRVPP